MACWPVASAAGGDLPIKPLRRILIGLSGLCLVIGGCSALIASQTASVHARLMRQIAASGLAQDQDVRFEPAWLHARSHGRLRLNESLCRNCPALAYQGTIHQGLGAWLMGDFALLSADYRLDLPQPALQPPLPQLGVHAEQGVTGPLRAALSLAASRHAWLGATHHYAFEHSGVSGWIQGPQLNLNLSALAVSRDNSPWFQFQGMEVQAAATQGFGLGMGAANFAIPAWDWEARDVRLEYQQQRARDQLDMQLTLNAPSSDSGGNNQRPPTDAQLRIQRLDIPATRAFARELPALLAPDTSAAARMLGLFSLYSLHGPGFFAARPALQFDSTSLPLASGFADTSIALAVTPAGAGRPPLHPLEWRRALQGQIDIQAPRAQLQRWWTWAGALVGAVTGLPRSYEALLEQGWARAQADGRDRLFFVLNPAIGVLPAP